MASLPQGFTLVDRNGQSSPVTDTHIAAPSAEVADLLAQQQAKNKELDELNNQLMRLKLDDSKYSVGQHQDNALVIVNAHRHWVVYYSEQRLIQFHQEFDVFAQAKAYYLSELHRLLKK